MTISKGFVIFLTLFGLLSLGLHPSSYASESNGGSSSNPGVPSAANPLGDVLGLQDKLPNALCDEGVISKPPSLDILRDSSQKLKDLEAAFSLDINLRESSLLSFMLGDPAAHLASPWVEQALRDQDSKPKEAVQLLARLKRQVSLEICLALVTPGKLQKLAQHEPSPFLSAQLGQLGRQSSKKVNGGGNSGQTHLEVFDSDGRYGHLAGKWWIGGWIEPFEIKSARVQHRKYVRLANPITNLTQFIVLMGKEGIPVGFFFPTGDVLPSSWDSLRKIPETETAKQKRVEVYRLMIELEAFAAVNKRPEHSDSIRKLQDFYKNLLGAYQIYPEETQFESYRKHAHIAVSEKSLKEMFDIDFFSALQGAQINGARVGLGLLLPDLKLQGMYEEFKSRLRKLEI